MITKNLIIASIEPRVSCVQCERANHYTTQQCLSNKIIKWLYTIHGLRLEVLYCGDDNRDYGGDNFRFPCKKYTVLLTKSYR